MTKPMPAKRLAQISARCEAATKGEWEVAPDGYTIWIDGDACYIAQVHPFDSRRAGNLDFIAHARQDLPACLAEIERLRGLVQCPTNKCECGNIINHDYCTQCLRQWES